MIYTLACWKMLARKFSLLDFQSIDVRVSRDNGLKTFLLVQENEKKLMFAGLNSGSETTQPILNGTKQPIFKIGQNSRFKTGQNSRFSK